MSQTSCARRILIAVDESDNSARAVQYVVRMLGGYGDIAIELLHVIQEPEEDFFPTAEERERWLAETRAGMEAAMERYRSILLAGGFAGCGVSTRVEVRRCPTLSGCILDEISGSQPDAVVVGRGGISAQEEFLFGSVSSAIVHRARGLAVWVVN